MTARKQALSRAEGAAPKRRSGGYVPAEQRSTDMIGVRVPRDTKAALAELCARRGTTVNALLSSYAAVTVAIDVSTEAKGEPVHLETISREAYEELSERCSDVWVSEDDGLVHFVGYEDEDDETGWRVTMPRVFDRDGD